MLRSVSKLIENGMSVLSTTETIRVFKADKGRYAIEDNFLCTDPQYFNTAEEAASEFLRLTEPCQSLWGTV